MTADHTTPATSRPAPAVADGANARLDAWARASHEASLRHLSPRAHARLAQARGPARSRPRRAGTWAWTTAFAAIAVLAVALQLKPDPNVAPVPHAPAMATAAPDGIGGDPVAALDENPDFYLWLASTDDVMPDTPEY